MAQHRRNGEVRSACRQDRQQGRIRDRHSGEAGEDKGHQRMDNRGTHCVGKQCRREATQARQMPRREQSHVQQEEGKKALQLGQDALLTAHDPAKSLLYFEQLNKKNPEYVSGWLLRGTALMALNRSPEAEGAFREAATRQPDLYSAEFGLGVSLNEQGHFDKAIAPLKKCVELAPASAEAH